MYARAIFSYFFSICPPYGYHWKKAGPRASVLVSHVAALGRTRSNQRCLSSARLTPCNPGLAKQPTPSVWTASNNRQPTPPQGTRSRNPLRPNLQQCATGGDPQDISAQLHARKGSQNPRPQAERGRGSANAKETQSQPPQPRPQRGRGRGASHPRRACRPEEIRTMCITQRKPRRGGGAARLPTTHPTAANANQGATAKRSNPAGTPPQRQTGKSAKRYITARRRGPGNPTQPPTGTSPARAPNRPRLPRRMHSGAQRRTREATTRR